MIKKLQRNFILLTMAILLVVFSLIFLTSYVLLNGQSKRNIDHILKDSYLTYIQTGDAMHVAGDNKFVAELTILNPEKKEYSLKAFYDGEFFSEQTVKEVVEFALSLDVDNGNVDEIYYLKHNSPFGFIIIGGDMTDILDTLNSSIIKALIVFIIIYLLLSLVATLVSFKVVSPVKQTVMKQRRFISNVSHELKTPITIISTNAEVLKSIDNNKWVSNIKSQTERMEVLVSDMLTLAKFDEDRIPLNKENFNLSDAIVSTALSFDALAFEKGKNLILEVPENISYVGDSSSVKKIVNILLDNAVKYASKGGNIIVKLKNEAKPVLTVYNDGSEIENQDSNRIFDRFFRGDNSRSRSSGGSGLGLAIAKGIADSNKWKISAKSILNKCMTITIIF